MKKIFWFSISLGAALMLFIAVAVICLAIGLSSRADEAKTPQPPTADSTVTHSAASQNSDSAEVLVIFDGEENCFLSLINVTSEGDLLFSVSFPSGKLDSIPLKQYIENNGIEKTVESLCGPFAHYVKIDERNFAEITDRYGGLVYNEGNGLEVLLTGAQALAHLNSATFTDFTAQIVNKARDRNLSDFFTYICNNTDNNLSYPLFYNIFKKEHIN